MPVDASLIPDNEDERLAAVRRYDVLDSPADGAFDRVTRLAARHFGVPISIVSIVDTDRIWFKSHHGVDVDEIGRDPGLCASAILGDEPWVVENAAVDPRALANPLVAGELGLRFYAGAPLRTSDGFNLGTLCVIDQQPREFSSRGRRGARRDWPRWSSTSSSCGSRPGAPSSRSWRCAGRPSRWPRDCSRACCRPSCPSLEGAESASLYLPADASEVGGDFFDAFTIGDDGARGRRRQRQGPAGGGRHRSGSQHDPLRVAVGRRSGGDPRQPQPHDAARPREDQIEHFCTVLLAFVTRAPDGLRLRLGSAGHAPALIVRGDGLPARRSATAGAPGRLACRRPPITLSLDAKRPARGSPARQKGAGRYIPRRRSTNGTVRSRIFTSFHSDQLADVEVVDLDHLVERDAWRSRGSATGRSCRASGAAGARCQPTTCASSSSDERARADEAHLAAQHVEQLRQLVERRRGAGSGRRA